MSSAQILVTNSSSASASTAIECNGFAHDCCNHIFLLLYMCQTLIRFLSSFMLVWCALLIASARCICAAKLARPAVYQTVIVHVVPQHALIVVVAALRSRCACWDVCVLDVSLIDMLNRIGLEATHRKLTKAKAINNNRGQTKEKQETDTNQW